MPKLFFLAQEAQQYVFCFYVRRTINAGFIARVEDNSTCLLRIPLKHTAYSTTASFRLPRFQYKYPGTPINTIIVPTSACLGRVMMVFSVQAPLIST